MPVRDPATVERFTRPYPGYARHRVIPEPTHIVGPVTILAVMVAGGYVLGRPSE